MIKKLKKLKRRNGELELKLRDVNERLSHEELLREHAHYRSVSVQTDPSGYRPYARHLHVKPNTRSNKQDNTDEQKRADRLLSMHNKLMKRYEKELKTNTTHTETIAALNLRIQDLENQLHRSREQVHRLERSLTPNGRRRRAGSRSHSASPFTNSQEFQRLKKERDQLAKDKKRLKKELQGLDEGFFDEIEDLKYALQQSAKLNKEYEKALRRTCKQFGVPYPMSSDDVRVASPHTRARPR
ncbi:centrosomal protein of 290 kDa-like isoform X2 [Acanthaster planci]|nr:centrosomal protein of 290 kDa-like isoform X2 [Acanthaster planci]